MLFCPQVERDLGDVDGFVPVGPRIPKLSENLKRKPRKSLVTGTKSVTNNIATATSASDNQMEKEKKVGY